ncbi:alpha-L-arabinofuranosidase C-terminal domain-containing protein [uncultured Chitinophaga sp.]|uniref:alpha-L-arabinofuranosidase C-terminal domain-containing protein n=1 Tax=uncultured Chitinophaga sp. TaxID=339340 RepID=UPI0025D54FBF|nr:alpha-L-arabinofuranosidase C-terminal domain-containing protein [uncultured Chitinophaga sp.]
MKRTFLALCGGLYMFSATAQKAVSVTVDVAKPEARVSPSLHGIFFEEISHGGEGGLYAELIQNRGFEESRIPQGVQLKNGWLVPDAAPHWFLNGKPSDWRMPWEIKSDYPYWKLNSKGGSQMTIALTQEKPLNAATPRSLKVTVNKVDVAAKHEVVNEGFWGINTVKGDTYTLTFFARTAADYKSGVTASLQTRDGKVLATNTFKSISSGEWKKYTCKLTATDTDPLAEFALSFNGTGTVYIDFVSLFPDKTFKGRKNGMRNDLGVLLADLKPAFLRWPGGCFVEGITIESAPNWKQTIGPLEKREATYSPWGYWASNGFGYHEYLQFCEDIKADAMYVFNVGIACEMRSGTFLGEEKVPGLIADVLDAIEYAIGPATSKWGKVRAANGHPAPFPLKYLEIGNEQHGVEYAKRYNQFYDAIKKKYPQLELIASMGIGDINRNTLDSMKKVDIADEHAYKAAWWSFTNSDHFDRYKRGAWDVYVGEYATNNGVGAGNMMATLSDAAYILSMERNGDLVKMSSYAPLFENVNTRHWPVNLINFDASRSFGRISYYLIKMMNDARADQNFAVTTAIAPEADPQPMYAGGIGLATWDTQTDYKDIQVIKDGKVVYQSDLVNNKLDWESTIGKWDLSDSVISMKAEGAQRFIALRNKSFDTYTLKLKARRNSGFNAFIIGFAAKDPRNMLRAHIGSWVNQNCVFESVTDGFNVSDVSVQKRLPKPIETGRWYDITLEVGKDKVDCYLDGKLLMSYSEPQKFMSIAGRDEQSGDIIVKMVNAYASQMTVNLDLKGITGIEAKAHQLDLSSPSLADENSLENPHAFVPKLSVISGIGANSKISLEPFTVSVIRIKDPSWKRTASK